MKLQNLKCTQCNKNFFVYPEDSQENFNFCPFGCDVIIGEQMILEMGEICFDDRNILDMIVIRRTKEMLEEALHALENLGEVQQND
jgi:hypothetical protein